MRTLITLLLVFGLAASAQAEHLTLKGFHVNMTKEEFIAHGKTLGATVVDPPFSESGQQDAVYLHFADCIRSYGSGYCAEFGEPYGLTLGGAPLESISWLHDDDDWYVRIAFTPTQKHTKTLYEAMLAKFGLPDALGRVPLGFTEREFFEWNQDENNRMYMHEAGTSVLLWLDLNTNPNTDDF